LRIAVLLVTVISLLGLILACPNDTSSSGGGSSETPPVSTPLPTPSAGDFDITISSPQTVGSVETDVLKVVDIKPKTDKSDGARIIYFTLEGTANKSTSVPQVRGNYAVSFDVAAVSGKWSAVNGLSAGILQVVNPGETPDQTPVATDFTVSNNLTQTLPNLSAVTVTPQSGKSTGARTVYYTGTGLTTYAKSTTLPQAAGTYTVTFDVAASTGWVAATNLYAGLLNILSATMGNQQIPEVGNFDITGTGGFLYDGSTRTVSVAWKSDVTPGLPVTAADIKYYDVNDSEVDPPKNAGVYNVRFTVTETGNWRGVTLDAGRLAINQATPISTDYTLSDNTQKVGSVHAVTVATAANKSPGAITIKYDGSADVPNPASPRTFAVTIDVAASDDGNWKAAPALFLGSLTVDRADPTFEITVQGKKWPDEVYSVLYTGAPITPTIAVAYNGTSLTATTHYTVTLANNTNVGTATVTVKGVTGTAYANLPDAVAEFDIMAKVNSITVSWNDSNDSLISLNGNVVPANGSIPLLRDGTVTIAKTGDNYTVTRWVLDGVIQSSREDEFTFDQSKGSNSLGTHNVTLVVTDNDTGRLLNTNITIKVSAGT